MTDGGATQYVMLMASLPHLGRPFTQKQLPISRYRLEQRLGLLAEVDAALLAQIETTLARHRSHLAETETAAVASADALLAATTRHPTLYALVRDQLEMRTALAALRRRQRGDPPPAPRSVWGVGRWTGWMARQWSVADFGLTCVFPWLPEAAALLTAGDSVGLERLILAQSWNLLDRYALGHDFDFAAIVLYVLRWNLVARWLAQNPEAALARFDALVTQALDTHPDSLAPLLA